MQKDLLAIASLALVTVGAAPEAAVERAVLCKSDDYGKPGDMPKGFRFKWVDRTSQNTQFFAYPTRRFTALGFPISRIFVSNGEHVDWEGYAILNGQFAQVMKRARAYYRHQPRHVRALDNDPPGREQMFAFKAEGLDRTARFRALGKQQTAIRCREA